jgi:hypothetical protein
MDCRMKRELSGVPSAMRVVLAGRERRLASEFLPQRLKCVLGASTGKVSTRSLVSAFSTDVAAVTVRIMMSLLVVSLVVVPALGAPITYTQSGIGSGSLNGVAFTDASFVITAFGDTANVVSCGSGSCFSNDNLSASIEIVGVGTVSFITPTRYFYNSIVGFSRGDDGTDLLSGPPVIAWDMASSVGPVSGTALLQQWEIEPSVSTTGGVLVFTAGSTQSTFTASVGLPNAQTFLDNFQLLAETFEPLAQPFVPIVGEFVDDHARLQAELQLAEQLPGPPAETHQTTWSEVWSALELLFACAPTPGLDCAWEIADQFLDVESKVFKINPTFESYGFSTQAHVQHGQLSIDDQFLTAFPFFGHEQSFSAVRVVDVLQIGDSQQVTFDVEGVGRLPEPVPEPASIVLLSTGLAIAALRRRRTRRRD